MKVPVVIGALVALSSLGWWLLRPTEPAGPTGPAVPLRDPPSNTVTDAAEVFRRAFWQHPGADDRILHAERREWSEDAVVSRWQSFLEVEPSEPLLDRLFGQNVFNLSTPRDPVKLPPDRPDWFPGETTRFDIRIGGGGEMVILHDRSARRLYALGTGLGFSQGVPPPQKPSPPPETERQGRLPPGSPPLPGK